MAKPTQQEIDALLDKLTDDKDKEIFTGILALLLAAQTQAVLYAHGLDMMGSLAGQIGIDTSTAVRDLDQQARQSNKALKATLAKVKDAYGEANGGIKAGMSAAEDFLREYRKQQDDPTVDSSDLFKGMASSLLNIVFPGAGQVFNIISGLNRA